MQITDGYYVQNSWASQPQVFRDRWSVQLVMDEMYNIVQFIMNFEAEYSRVWVAYDVRAWITTSFMLLLWLFVCVRLFGCLVRLKVFMLSFIKLSCIRCRCSKEERIHNIASSPLCLVFMKFLILTVIKLGFRHCIG